MRRKLTIWAALAMVLALGVPPAVAGGQSDLAPARRGTARFYDVGKAEEAGYVSTLNDLGCFENPGTGGMGLHYLDPSALDASLDPSRPEALVYEMDEDGSLELVGLEYIVPIAAWSGTELPMLFGRQFHAHPVLPLYVLHAWVWQPNPDGMFEDWNPAVDLCPEGAPIFGD